MNPTPHSHSPLLRLALGAWLMAAGPTALEATTNASLELEPCHVRGVARQVLCGTHVVPENRAEPDGDGRRLPLATVVVPATSPRDDAEPIFILAGGPGQAATAIVSVVLAPFAELNRHHDLVFVDQRGSAADSPMRCPDPDEDDAQGPADLATQFVRPDVKEQVEACLEDLDADPRLYTTPIAMDDLDDVRHALGFERIHLWGGSYGTRAALVYLDRHGEHVATAVLDGAAPVQMALPSSMAADAERALDRLIADCESEPSCAEAFPDLAMRPEEIRQMLAARLEADPEAEFEVPHPVTGEPVPVTVTPENFPAFLRATLYDVDTSRLVPLVLEEAVRGRFEPFVALAWQDPGNEGATISLGLFLSVVCAEDARLVDTARAKEEAEATFLGGLLVESIGEACEVWPAGEVPEDYFEPVESTVPVLILSGDLDPVTPPRWGEAVAESLPRSRHVVVPATGHGTIRHGCVAEIVTSFVESDGAERPSTECVNRLDRPRFFLDRLGPGGSTSANGDDSADTMPADADETTEEASR